jgi:dipeptidyl aminopeptidase/acylaminoacyl peptidase
MAYRLNIDIGATSTSASYYRAEESGVVRLNPGAPDLPTAQFVMGGSVQVASLAETLRSIVATASQQLGETPASVEVTYPSSWDPMQLLLLWEALVLAGIPDAATQAVADPKPSAAAPRVEDETAEAETALLSQPAARRIEPEPSDAETALLSHPAAPIAKRWLVVTVLAAINAGVAAGVLVVDGPRPTSLAGGPESRTVSSSPAATQSAPSSIPPRTSQPSRGRSGVDLPTSRALAPHQFVVPRGRNDATQLNLASVSGVVPPRTLPSTISGRNSWPILSADRRTIIYISQVTGSLRTRAVDGSGDRALIKSRLKNCGQITRASWSPADQSIMVVVCRAAGRPDRLLVIKLDGTVVRELRTGQRRIEDPAISPDGRTVAYWAHSAVGAF